MRDDNFFFGSVADVNRNGYNNLTLKILEECTTNFHTAFCSKNQFLEIPEKGDSVLAYWSNDYGRRHIRGLVINDREIFYEPFVISVGNEFPEDDNMWNDTILRSVDATESGYTLNLSNGTSICVFHKDCGVISVPPKEGDYCRLYGKGFGYSVRGIFINGKKLRYETQEQCDDNHKKYLQNMEKEKEVKWQKNKESMMERVAMLPQCFQDRINRFMTANQDFGRDYLDYELMVCEQAVLMADALFMPLVNRMGVEALPEFYDSVRKWSMEELEDKVKGIDQGHSGNSLSCALNLAYAFGSSKLDYVKNSHGALAPLVGCEKYGCTH